MRIPQGRRGISVGVGAVLAIVAVVVGVVLLVTGGSKSSVDTTQVGGTLTGDRLRQVLGHLFDGVSTVHVAYVASGGTTTAAADVVTGPPVQATITLSSSTAPAQTGTVVIKDGKAYFTQPSFGSKWLLMSSADDGVSGAPAFGQTAFELRYLGPTATATYKGTETINGTATREYVLSATAATSSASPASTAQVVATVWIDNTGRLIRYTYSPTGVGDWVTATYSNWGEAVTVQAPPSKDVNVLQGTM